jgi:hypothetical protein
LLRRPPVPKKGSEFERQFCGDLSIWWTGGKSDSEFWRTAMSGGRATVRGRQGKTTTGHAGDICATGKKGLGLTKRITFELKRGYNKVANVHTLLDLRLKTDAQQEYEKWVLQAEAAATLAGTPWWMIVHRRDGRQATVMVPYRLWKKLGGATPCPSILLTFTCRRGKVGRMKHLYRTVMILTLEEFFEIVTPDDIRRL